MCIICVEMTKGKLTTSEAYRNLGEMENVLPQEHYEEIHKKLTDELHAEDEPLFDDKPSFDWFLPWV